MVKIYCIRHLLLHYDETVSAVADDADDAVDATDTGIVKQLKRGIWQK